MDKCRVEGCDRPVRVKKEALCGKHYARLRRHGDPLAWKRPKRPVCSVDECEHRAAAKGLCDTHYRRLRRYGSTDKPERPTVCAVDGCDRGVASRGLCDKHYRRHMAGTDGDKRCVFCGKIIDPALNRNVAYCADTCKQKANYLKRAESNRANQLRLYALTAETFDALLAGQGGVCAICSGEATGRGWHVDHCHDSGTVRGILCHQCNVGLGHFKDDPVRLAAAIAYLEAPMT